LPMPHLLIPFPWPPAAGHSLTAAAFISLGPWKKIS